MYLKMENEDYSHILNKIDYNTFDEESEAFEYTVNKSKELFNLFFANNSQDALIEFIQNPIARIKKILFELIKEYNDTLYHLLLDNYYLDDKSIFNRLFVLILTKSFIELASNYEIFHNFIIEEYYQNNMHYYTDSLNSAEVAVLQDMNKYFKLEMHKIVQNVIDLILNDAVNGLRIEFFVEENEILKYICEEYSEEFDKNISDIFGKYESEFIFQFFETAEDTIKFLPENEDWNQITSINVFYQRVVDFIFTQEIFNSEDKVDFPSETESDTLNMLHIAGDDYRLVSSILKLINFTLDTIKLIFYFDESLVETIIYQYVKIVKSYATNSRLLIIEGEGVKKGKMKSINQKHIIMLNSSITVLKHLVDSLTIKIEKLNKDKEIIMPSLEELSLTLNKIKLDCMDKIYELFLNTTTDSFDELNKIEFAKYPILSQKEYSSYCIKFTTFKTLYLHMLNGFANEDITCILNDNLTMYFDKLEKIIVNSALNKVETDPSLKQLKNDLLFFKKFLRQFQPLDTTVFRDKIDSIISAVIPQRLNKKKKIKNEENK